LAKPSNFPGGSKKDIIVKIGADSTALLIEDASLPTCAREVDSSNPCTTDGTDKIICSKNGKSYQTDSSACKAAGDGTKYLKNDNVEEASATTDTAKYYICDSGTCQLVKGHLVSGSNVVTCNGWNEGCSLTATADLPTACTADGTDEGNIINESSALKLCFGTTK